MKQSKFQKVIEEKQAERESAIKLVRSGRSAYSLGLDNFCLKGVDLHKSYQKDGSFHLFE